MADWLPYVLGAYVLAQLAIAAFAARFVRSETDYLLAGRNLGIGVAAVSLFATWFGAETVVGSSGAVAAEGLSGGRADPFGYTICLLLMAVFLAARMRAGNYVTFGDFFRERFGSAAEKLAVLIMVPTSLIWAAAQILAFGTILTAVTGFPIGATLVFTVVVVIAYSSLGGMIGDVLTDLVQGGIVIAGLAILLIGVIARSGGVDGAIAAIGPDQLRLLSPDESVLSRIDGWMIPILGSLVAQEAISRVLATKSVSTARRACLVGAGLYLTVGLFPVALGLVGRSLIDPVAEQDAFLPALALEVMPPALYVVFLGALVSAILSTIDSALLAVASLAGHNIVVPLFPRITERSKTRIERAIVVVSGVACYFIAVGGDTIYGLVELSSSFGSGGILVCVVVGLHARFGRAKAAISALVTGMAITLAGDEVFSLEAPYLAAVGGSLGVYVLMGLLERGGEAASGIRSETA